MKRNGYEVNGENQFFSGKEKRESALRIMEALSGVDAELLERSETLAGAEVLSETNAEPMEGMEVLQGIDGGYLNDSGILQDEEAAVSDQDSAGCGHKAVLSGKQERPGNGRKGKKALWQYARPWAAVLCLAVVGVLGWSGYQLTRQAGENMSGGIMNDMALKMDRGDAGAAAAEEMEEAAPQEAGLTEGIEEGADGAAWGNGNYAGGAEGEAENAAGDSAQKNGNANSAAQQTENTKEKAEQVKEETTDRMSQESAGNAVGNAAGSGQNPADEYSDSIGRPEGNLDSSDLLPGQESADKEPASGESVEADTEGCPPANLKKLTEKEARKQKELGQYLPESIPRGYAFEEAFSNLDQKEANLAAVWRRRLDSITWRVAKAEEVPETVDIDKPETYDLRLYEIPHAESVPLEYHQSVDNPVFVWEDFGLEIVESRMMSYNDRGDTDTPRGNFAVLCPDNIVIYFSGRGTAEEIWEMFCSVEALN